MTDIERLCERLDAATKARFRQSTLDIADHEDSHVTVKLIKEASLALRQSEQKLREAERKLLEHNDVFDNVGWKCPGCGRCYQSGHWQCEYCVPSLKDRIRGG